LGLNRVLSPDIYLGLKPVIQDSKGRLHLGGTGEIVEWLVVMRRLNEERLLDHAIAEGSVTREDVENLIEALGRLYSRPLKNPPSRAEVLPAWAAMLERTARSLRRPDFGLPQDRVEEVLAEMTRFLDESSEMILERVDAGWIRDCHGDLRPQHVYLGPPLRLIDRLEFDERLRKRDPFEEIMDFGLECERMGAAWILPMLLDGLEACLGCRPDVRLLGFYAGMRASLRARFAIEHIGSERGSPAGWRERAMASLDLARKHAFRQS
jgi:aminoglycoside phosphotransferase family enzyme